MNGKEMAAMAKALYDKYGECSSIEVKATAYTSGDKKLVAVVYVASIGHSENFKTTKEVKQYVSKLLENP